MNKSIIILSILAILAIFMLAGCKDSIDDGIDKITDAVTSSKDSNVAEMATECNALCDIDADDYCEKTRVITTEGKEITGTCRAFSKKDNIPGFERCEGFCRRFDKAGTKCYVQGAEDADCDGIV